MSLRINYAGDILEQSFNESVNSNEMLITGYIGKEIMYINNQNQLSEGKLMYVKDKCIAILTKDSSITIIDNFSEGKIIGKSLSSQNFNSPSISLKLNNTSTSGNRLELNYITSGLGWSSSYYLILDSTENYVDLSSDVILSNTSNYSFQNAEIKLIAGDINFDLERNDLLGRGKQLGGTYSVRLLETDNGFNEYTSYMLKQLTNIPAKGTKNIPFMSAKKIKFKKEYFFEPSNSYLKTDKVNVLISIQNTKANNIGFLLPRGVVQIYRTNGKSLEFTGSDKIVNTTEDDSILINIGDAINLTAYEIVFQTVKISDKKKEVTYQIRFKNMKNEDVTVTVEKVFSPVNNILKSSVEYKRINDERVRFKVPVKRRSETILEYTVSLESMN